MSRTGTSLLYQLLYGHSAIYFAPYRIQFVCEQPFGFPLLEWGDKDAFLDMLIHKTTIVVSDGAWPNIRTDTLANFKHITKDDLIIGDNALDSAIRTIHHILGIDILQAAYYCLHDDHSYMLGSKAFLNYECKILTTIRNPIEMIASKKNMLVMYVYGRKNPKDFLLSKEMIQKELLRAYFSWWAASYENEHCFCVLYSLLKNSATSLECMKKIASYLGIAFEQSLATDSNFLQKNELHNELLANGTNLSTIEYLSKGSLKQKIDGSTLSLSTEEFNVINNIIHAAAFDRYADIGYFFKHFASFHTYEYIADETLKTWQELYKGGEMKKLFEHYSALNYGRANAESAFEPFGGGQS